MTITFDSVELIDPAPFDENPQVLSNDTVLESGKHSCQTSSETALAVAFKCITSTKTDMTNLRAKIGTVATLSLDGTDYTKCHISSFSSQQWFPGEWTYSVSFKQDTT